MWVQGQGERMMRPYTCGRVFVCHGDQGGSPLPPHVR